MKLSDISIQRPVLATVMTLLLMLFGLLSYSKLPIRQYPDITFPIISVQTVYPRADAKLVESDVTTIIEEALSGIEGLRTLRSISREGLARAGVEELDSHVRDDGYVRVTRHEEERMNAGGPVAPLGDKVARCGP